jgi:signal transduction histidine kinase
MSPAEALLRQNLQRLQILHDIDRSILSNRSMVEIARQALEGISALVPAYRAGRVFVFNGPRADLLAHHPEAVPSPSDTASPPSLPLEDLGVDLAALSDGRAIIIPDLAALQSQQPVQRALQQLGVRSYLAAPMRYGDQLIGLLGLAAGLPDVFLPEHVQIAVEAADSLAVALQENRLRQAEERRHREAEVMRDMLAALAGANDLKSSLEALLVHLHSLIHYDRAGLFLVDENRRYAPAGDGDAPAVYPENDPLVSELRRQRRPLIAADAHNDPRFDQWPDLRDLRGWLGAPLLAGEEMLGFLSLGSLEPDAYTSADAETIATFAEQAAQVLARTLKGEQSQRRTEELEVLSTITSALGQAERGENTLGAIVEQLTHFFGALRGLLLTPDVGGQSLTVQACQEDHLCGLALPQGEHWLWQVMDSGQISANDVAALNFTGASPFYAAALRGCQSAAAIPLRSEEAVFGLLLLGFEAKRKFTAHNLRLFQTVAEMAAMALRRAVVLEGLERQVRLRTQHLSTLYHINALASEPGNVLAALEDVLYVAVATLEGSGGAVHFLDENGVLGLAAQNGLAPEDLAGLEHLSADELFWRSLLESTGPLVIADLRSEPGAPEALHGVGRRGRPAYLGATIRAKGQPLGLLSIFGRTIHDVSIEDVTLFSTIADQIGGMIERARLMKQAELAAVVQERQRLARELHDSVTQLLYSQVLFSGAALKTLRKGERAVAEQHLQRIEQAAQQALKEMRLLVYELRPSDELDEGLGKALERRLNAVEKRTGIGVRLVRENLPSLERQVEMALYRIAEEALNNTLKHAQASLVTVTLRGEAGRLYLEVADDGRGFDPPAALRQGGMGLANIYDRAAALGGQADILSQPGAGARVCVNLPCASSSGSSHEQTD